MSRDDSRGSIAASSGERGADRGAESRGGCRVMAVNPLDVPPDPATSFQPRSGRRGTGFLTGPLRLGTTPSATVGPYLAIGLTWPDGAWAAAEGTPGGIWIRGRVFDGAGDLVPDAMVETWQADPDGGFPSPEDPRGASSYPGFRGYARVATAQPPGVPSYAAQLPSGQVSPIAR